MKFMKQQMQSRIAQLESGEATTNTESSEDSTEQGGDQ